MDRVSEAAALRERGRQLREAIRQREGRLLRAWRWVGFELRARTEPLGALLALGCFLGLVIAIDSPARLADRIARANHKFVPPEPYDRDQRAVIAVDDDGHLVLAVGATGFELRRVDGASSGVFVIRQLPTQPSTFDVLVSSQGKTQLVLAQDGDLFSIQRPSDPSTSRTFRRGPIWLWVVRDGVVGPPQRIRWDHHQPHRLGHLYEHPAEAVIEIAVGWNRHYLVFDRRSGERSWWSERHVRAAWFAMLGLLAGLLIRRRLGEGVWGLTLMDTLVWVGCLVALAATLDPITRV